MFPPQTGEGKRELRAAGCQVECGETLAFLSRVGLHQGVWWRVPWVPCSSWQLPLHSCLLPSGTWALKADLCAFTFAVALPRQPTRPGRCADPAHLFSRESCTWCLNVGGRLPTPALRFLGSPCLPSTQPGLSSVPAALQAGVKTNSVGVGVWSSSPPGTPASRRPSNPARRCSCRRSARQIGTLHHDLSPVP